MSTSLWNGAPQQRLATPEVVAWSCPLPPSRIQLRALVYSWRGRNERARADMVDELARQPNGVFLDIVRETVRPTVRVVQLFLSPVDDATDATRGHASGSDA